MTHLQGLLLILTLLLPIKFTNSQEFSSSASSPYMIQYDASLASRKIDKLGDRTDYLNQGRSYPTHNPNSLFKESSQYITQFDTLPYQEFENSIYHSKTTWLVIFYANWCGHSRNLARLFNPKIKELFGNYQNSWKYVLKIGVVDCGFLKDEKYKRNALLMCGKHGNVLGYPTAKFYDPGMMYSLENFENLKKMQNIRRILEGPDYKMWISRYIAIGSSGDRLKWRYPSRQPRPVLDFDKSDTLARDFLLKNVNYERETRYVAIVKLGENFEILDYAALVLDYSSYRGIVFYLLHDFSPSDGSKSKSNQSRTASVTLYRYCEASIKMSIPDFRRMVRTFKGINIGHEVYDNTIGKDIYKVNPSKWECRSYNTYWRPVPEKKLPEITRVRPQPRRNDRLDQELSRERSREKHRKVVTNRRPEWKENERKPKSKPKTKPKQRQRQKENPKRPTNNRNSIQKQSETKIKKPQVIKPIRPQTPTKPKKVQKSPNSRNPENQKRKSPIITKQIEIIKPKMKEILQTNEMNKKSSRKKPKQKEQKSPRPLGPTVEIQEEDIIEPEIVAVETNTDPDKENQKIIWKRPKVYSPYTKVEEDKTMLSTPKRTSPRKKVQSQDEKPQIKEDKPDTTTLAPKVIKQSTTQSTKTQTTQPLFIEEKTQITNNNSIKIIEIEQAKQSNIMDVLLPLIALLIVALLAFLCLTLK